MNYAQHFLSEQPTHTPGHSVTSDLIDRGIHFATETITGGRIYSYKPDACFPLPCEIAYLGAFGFSSTHTEAIFLDLDSGKGAGKGFTPADLDQTTEAIRERVPFALVRLSKSGKVNRQVILYIGRIPLADPEAPRASHFLHQSAAVEYLTDLLKPHLPERFFPLPFDSFNRYCVAYSAGIDPPESDSALAPYKVLVEPTERDHPIPQAYLDKLPAVPVRQPRKQGQPLTDIDQLDELCCPMLWPENQALLDELESTSQHDFWIDGDSIYTHTTELARVAHTHGYEKLPTAATGNLDKEDGPRINMVCSFGDNCIYCTSYRDEPDWEATPNGFCKHTIYKRTTEEGKKPNVAARVLSLLTQHVYLQDTDSLAYYCINPDGVDSRPLRVGSDEFVDSIYGEYYRKHGDQIKSRNSVTNALRTLGGLFRQVPPPSRPIGTRIVKMPRTTDDPAPPIFYNLGRAVIEITSNGWQILDPGNCPVVFPPLPDNQCLPIPERGGSIGPWLDLINVDEQVKPLVANIPVCVLIGRNIAAAFIGESGTGKSSNIRRILDVAHPERDDDGETPAGGIPESARDAKVAGSKSPVIASDNMSHLSKDLSDALCLIVTRTIQSERQLHTNDREIRIASSATVLMGMVDDIIKRQDLRNRCVIFKVPDPSEEAREVYERRRLTFQQELPKVLGAFFDAAVVAYHEMLTPHHKAIPQAPHLGYFGRIGQATESVFGFPPDSFANAFVTNKVEVSTPDADEFLAVLTDIARDGYKGSPDDLRGRVMKGLGSCGVSIDLPHLATPQTLGQWLSRNSGVLASCGIHAENTRTKSGRYWTLTEATNV